MYSGIALPKTPSLIRFSYKIYVDGKFREKGIEETTLEDFNQSIEAYKNQGYISNNCYKLDGSVVVNMVHVGNGCLLKDVQLIGTMKRLKA